MHETTRSTGCTKALGLAFVERVCRQLSEIRLGIELHLRGLSLSNTVDVLENFGVDRCRTAVHNWVKKSDLEPRDGRESKTITLKETTVKIDGEGYWLLAAVNPEMNIFFHVGVYSARTTVATKMFLVSYRTSMPSMTPSFSSAVDRGFRLDYSNSA